MRRPVLKACAPTSGRTATSTASIGGVQRRALPSQVIAARREALKTLARPGRLLRSRRIGPAATLQYTTAHALFVKFARTHGLELRSLKAIDNAMCKNLHALFLSGAHLWKRRSALFCTIWCREMNKREVHVFPLSREQLAGWSRAAPEPSRDPMPWEACLLIARDLVGVSQEGVVAAGALLTQYDAYLRTAEVLSLRRSDVSFADDPTPLRYPRVKITLAPLVHGDTLPLRRAKNGEFDGSVTISDAPSGAAGRGLVADVAGAACAQARRPQQLPLEAYECLFQGGGVGGRCGSCRLVPHSARHGGLSTDAALQLRSQPVMQRHGRWLSTQSVRRYEEHRNLMRQRQRMTRAQLAAAKKAAAELRVIFKKGARCPRARYGKMGRDRLIERAEGARLRSGSP